MAQRPCGIYYEVHEHGYRRDKWLPLISLSADAKICHTLSRLTLKQAFSNPKKEAISEATYSFPIYEGAAIVDFTCKIDNRIIRGIVRDKHTARKIYEAAKEEGQQAALMMYNTPDVWSIKISNIPADGKVEVEITVVSELKHDAQVDGIRFTLPTNIAPRYGHAPDNLPLGISTESRGIQITTAVTTTSALMSLQSPSHPIQVGMGTHIPNTSLSKEEFDVCKGYTTLSQKDTALDKDFVLLIVSDGIGEPQAIVETHSALPNSRALLLSLVPKFNLPRIKPEIVFIADRSGSMGPQIPQLKSALTVFLKSLPVGLKFNICSFGSTHSFLWPKSMPYDQDNLNTALKHVESFTSNFGGTEMFPPIEAAFKNRYMDLETEIMVLTDGEIWNPEPLFKLVKAECEGGKVRLFSLGIGDDVSHALVEGLARAGKGYAQIVGNQDKLDVKVVQMLKAALGAHVKDYHLVFPDDSSHVTEKSDEKEQEEGGFEFVEREVGSDAGKTAMEVDDSDNRLKKKTISLYDDTSDNILEDSSSEDRFSHLLAFQPPSRLQTPYSIPPLYTFSRTNVYTFLSGSETTPRSVTVRGITSSGLSLELEVPVKHVGNGTTVHQLAAKKLLQELEEGGSYIHSGKFGIDPKDEGKFMDWIEREAVRVGTTFGVAGKWTSFVAVENVVGLEQQMQQLKVDTDSVMFKSASLRAKSSSRHRCAPSGCMSGGSPGGVEYLKSNVSLMSTPAYGTPQFGNSTTTTSLRGGGPRVLGAPLKFAFQRSAVAPQVALHQMDTTKVVQVDPDLEGRTLVTERPRLEIVGDAANKTYALLRMQAFDGSFPPGAGTWAPKITEAFKTWIQQEHEGPWVVTLRAVPEEELEKLLASAVALAIFQGDLKDSKDLWEMVVEKTEDWGLGEVGQTAWNALKSWINQQAALADDLDKQSFWVSHKH